MGRKVSDEAFRAAWLEEGGEARKVGERLNLTERGVYMRRIRVEKKLGVHLPSAGMSGHIGRGDAGAPAYNYNPRLRIDGFAGTAISFSDCHFWPGISETLAYRALLEVIREIKPKLVIANGDVLDGAKISRFPPDGWDRRPRLSDELEEVKTRMAEIRHAFRGARTIRTIGNHDTRFDRWLAVNASEFDGIDGFRLKHHLPAWEECISTWVNDTAVFKHRIGGGVGAARMNALKSGKTTVTGHTHTLKSEPVEDYNGRRWGVEDGSLADVSCSEGAGPQFAYAEDGPGQGRSGFAVLTFLPSGELISPELVECIRGVAWFRGQKVVSERKRAA